MAWEPANTSVIHADLPGTRKQGSQRHARIAMVKW